MAKSKTSRSNSVSKGTRLWSHYVLSLALISIFILGILFIIINKEVQTARLYSKISSSPTPFTIPFIRDVSSPPAFSAGLNPFVTPIPYVDCETVEGLEFEYDYLYPRKDKCYFEQGIARNDTSLCKKLAENQAATCITQIAQNTNNWKICNEFTDQYHFVNCVTPFALHVAQTDVEQALKMCRQNYNRCHADVINHYVTILNISQRDLTYRCLKYQQGDELTRVLCRTKVGFLAGWEAHQELLYIYGQKYPEKAHQLCQLLPIFDPENPFVLKNCTEQTRLGTAEMTRTISNYYRFLQKHPNGYGEPR
jgi:ribulose bisphosphate carboxylase small subunit